MQSTIDLLVERGYVAHKVKGDGSLREGGGFESGDAGALTRRALPDDSCARLVIACEPPVSARLQGSAR